MARCEQNVCRRMWKLPVTLSPASRCADLIQARSTFGVSTDPSSCRSTRALRRWRTADRAAASFSVIGTVRLSVPKTCRDVRPGLVARAVTRLTV